MNDALFEELLASVRDMGRRMRGQPVAGVVVRDFPEPDVKAIRERTSGAASLMPAATLMRSNPLADTPPPAQRSHDDTVVDLLKTDPAFASEYLSVAFKEADQPGGHQALLAALRHIAEA